MARRALGPAALLLALALSVPYWPDSAMLGTFGRMFDSLAPQILALAALLALPALLLGPGRGTRGIAAALVAGSLAGLALLIQPGRAAAPDMTARDATEADMAAPGATAAEAAGRGSLEVLWFNLYGDNPLPPETLAAGIEASGADLVLLAEGGPIRSMLPRLARLYPHQAGCGRRLCEVVVLSKRPFPEGVAWTRASRTERLASLRQPAAPGQVATADGSADGSANGSADGPGTAPPAALGVIAVQLPKPWFYGYVEADRWFLLDRIAARQGPLLVAGDFNSAAWSRPMRQLLARSGLTEAPGWPVATWPVAAGRFGVPIDHLLVGGGARIEDLRPWGAGLGSNHLGLRARVSWPLHPAAAADPPPVAFPSTATSPAGYRAP